MTKLIATGLFALSLTAAVAATPRPDDKPGANGDEKKGAAALEGGYTLVSGEKDGKAIPEAEIKGSIVKFIGNQIVGTDKDKKEFFSSTFTLDTSTKPWGITMTSKSPKDGKEVKATGLVKKDGDTVTIIYALPGGDAPTEFKTKANQHLFVLKNMNKGAKDPVKP